MFNLLSIWIHIINSIFSGYYTSLFLKNKQGKTITITLWSVLYFVAQVILFEVIYSWYPFHNIIGAIMHLVLFIGMQLLFFCKDLSRQLFVCFSFVAGKEIVKYIASVCNYVLCTIMGSWMNTLIMQGKIITNSQIKAVNDWMVGVMNVASALLYAVLFGIYLLCIHKKYVRKEYSLQIGETMFLILPSISAICISITLRIMVLTVENGTTTLIFNTVPETLFWIPVICLLLLGTVIANVILFQNMVQYHEENRKVTLLENQVFHMQKEVQEIQDIYADMRGLRHDLRGHIQNITQYVKKHNPAEEEELNTYIRKMEKTVSRLDFSYQSGNSMTDIMIHQKIQEAEKAEVTFLVDFHYPKELQIDVYDVGIILHNALENAIEAASLVEMDKYVLVHSYVKGNLFFIEVENNFVREIKIHKESGLPESSKPNKKFHGMGLTNIQRCARKYKGDIDIVIGTSKQEQKIFNLTVMLNGKPVEP